jgi:glycosyltransferase involved in cell wall biosynthesis
VTGFPSVSVCFPAYNEEPTIAAVLDEAIALLGTSGIDYEILVCDDGSGDQTGAVIDAIARRVPAMRVIRHAENRGIRETFEHLYHEAAKDFVFLNSTDGQWDTRVLFELLPLTRDWDVIIASRREKHYRPGRSVVSWGFNQIPRLLYGVRTHDAGAVKLVRREIIERFPLVSRSPFSEAERLIRAARAGYRITERVTQTSVRRTGRSRGVSAALVVEALRDVARVWRALRAEPASRPGETPTTESSSHADQR